MAPGILANSTSQHGSAVFPRLAKDPRPLPILAQEPEAAVLTSRLARSSRLYTSPLALYEAALGLARSARIPIAIAQTEIETIENYTRRLEEACANDLGFIWLSGTHRPDHHALWRFWQANRAALKTLFKRTVRVALL